MSRLIVKNLPKGVTDAKLKELFSEKGIVTDVQLKYTKDGKFRRFGFVGFKTEDQAKAAIEYFDKTCIDTSKISVESCAGLGDPSKPKAWSKYAVDSSARDKLSKKEEIAKEPKDDGPAKAKTKREKKKEKKEKKDMKIAEALAKHKDDPLFSEFLESHSGTKAKMVWDNDAAESCEKSVNVESDDSKENLDNDENCDDEADTGSEDEEKEGEEKIAVKKMTDLEYMESLKKGKEAAKANLIVDESTHGPTKFFTVKVRGLGYNHKKKHLKQFFHPLKPKSIRVPQKIKGIAYVGFKAERHMNAALNKNKSFLEGKRLLVTKYENKVDVEASNDNDNNNGNPRWKKQEDAIQNEESIAESGRMFLRNLSYTTTEDDIRKLFEKYGPLSEVNLPIDRTTRKPKGFGTVTFMLPEHAVRAYSELDGSILDGRMLHLIPGKVQPSATEMLEREDLGYKQRKELEKKATAGSSHNWNTLFLGQNAVAEAIATAYNTTKDTVLDDGVKGTSVAVRLALGETQLVQDTKKFLENNGVRLDAFNQAPDKRSKTVILAKNLPPQTEAREIREKFAEFGEIARVVMPPSGITALVEFFEPSEARKAFIKLAYTKFKYLPLYLEWAPDNTFNVAAKKSDEPVSQKIEETREKSNVVETKVNKVEETDDEEDDDEPEPDTTLFVKNLNFTTTEDTLKKYFSKCGKLHYATVATKKDPNNPGQKLSMGYGFVRYKLKSDADRALKELQMTSLEEKTLELKRSERTLGTDVVTTKKTSKVTPQTGTKIMIKNIPFQANVDEITELFKAFGELKAVRLPKKLLGVEKHRGFAFVEYYTKSEAKRAFKALCQSTHLYGRRLVLEWAQAEENVDDIRKRTAKHFHQEESGNKKSKKANLDPESVGLAVQ